MRKSLAFVPLPLLLAGCAVPATVQRIGVGYNTAVANLTDQLALLNVVRAHNGYPLHYTSLTRLSGSLTFKGTAGIGSQFGVRGHNDTTTTNTTTANSDVGTSIADAVTSAGRQFTPSIGAEVDSNPSFDVEVNDTKEFYQGVLTAVEPGTIAGLIAQGYDAESLLDLTVIRFDFTLKTKLDGLDAEIGTHLLSIYNASPPPNPDKMQAFEQEQLHTLLACYDFSTTDGKATDLAPVSRLVTEKGGSGLSIKDLALLDGDKLDLSGPIGKTTAGDEEIMIQRPGKRTGSFTWSGLAERCRTMISETVKGFADPAHLPAAPPVDRVFIGHNKVLLITKKDDKFFPSIADAKMSVMFRSPEAVIQFVGDCLKPGGSDGTLTCRHGDKVLFQIHKGRGGPGSVSAELGDDRYYIDQTDDGGRATLKTLGLIEKLIDLHKSAADTPSTVPVHVIS